MNCFATWFIVACMTKKSGRDDTFMISDELRDHIDVSGEQEEKFKDNFIFVRIVDEEEEIFGSMLGSESSDDFLKIDMRVTTRCGIAVLKKNVGNHKLCSHVYVKVGEQEEVKLDKSYTMSTVKIIDFDPVTKMCTLCVDMQTCQ